MHVCATPDQWRATGAAHPTGFRVRRLRPVGAERRDAGGAGRRSASRPSQSDGAAYFLSSAAWASVAAVAIASAALVFWSIAASICVESAALTSAYCGIEGRERA